MMCHRPNESQQRRMTRSVAVILVLAACGGDADAPDAPAPPDGPLAVDAFVADAPPPNLDLDILFLIDNSGSMGEEQTSLTESIGSDFFEVLDARLGVRPNLHVGVISSNMGAGGQAITGCEGDGDGGRLQRDQRYPGCGQPEGYFIRDIAAPGGRDTNYFGEINETFTCIGRLGTTGCGFEQPLGAITRALDGTNPENDGFRRPGAYLAIIIVTDEDDCSADNSAIFDPGDATLGPFSSFRCTEYGVLCDGAPITRMPASYTSCVPRAESFYLSDPAEHRAFLAGLMPFGDMLLVATIAGDVTPFVVGANMNGDPVLEPSCTSGEGESAPPVRLASIADEQVSICAVGINDGLRVIAERIADRMTSP
jgi:hypothetical protein